MRTIPVWILILALSITAAPVSTVPQTDASSRAAMVARLSGKEPPLLFGAVTLLLLDYVEAVIPKNKLAGIYNARDRADLLQRIESAAGKDLIDLGNDMFVFYESRAPKTFDPSWATFPAGSFLVHVHPGSAADKDREFVSREIVSVTTNILRALGLTGEFAAATATLKPAAPESAGLIPIYLHASRKEEGAVHIGKTSYGSATLGATIVEKQGKLTFEAHILYFNALFLPVIEHEAAHAVVLLGTFDGQALSAKPLEGEADLRRAFFAGYRKIPTFLQEGLGDWAFYYHGFQSHWGLLPSPESLLAQLRREKRTLPLPELLAGDIRYAAKNRKAYSLEAAAFLEFLMRTQGTDKVKRWLFTNETNGTKAFSGVFGTSLDAMEKEFLAAGRIQE